jgi:hypothetical protein
MTDTDKTKLDELTEAINSAERLKATEVAQTAKETLANDPVHKAERRAKRIQDTAETAGQLTRKTLRNVGDTLDDISVVAKGFRWIGQKASEVKQAFEGLGDLPVIGPVFKHTGNAIGWAAKSYVSLWDNVVYKKDKGESKTSWGKKFGFIPWRETETIREPSGEKTFSKKRASAMLAATFALASAFTPTIVGEAVRFMTVEPAVDAASMMLTLRKDTFYLSESQELDPAHNMHQVKGTRVEDGRSTADAVYFRVRHRLSHDVWNMAVHGNPNYVTDHVVAPIAPGINKCEVTYYGYRMSSSWTSRMMRSLEIYPTMLEAKCNSITHMSPTNATPSMSVTQQSIAP